MQPPCKFNLQCLICPSCFSWWSSTRSQIRSTARSSTANRASIEASRFISPRLEHRFEKFTAPGAPAFSPTAWKILPPKSSTRTKLSTRQLRLAWADVQSLQVLATVATRAGVSSCRLSRRGCRRPAVAATRLGSTRSRSSSNTTATATTISSTSKWTPPRRLRKSATRPPWILCQKVQRGYLSDAASAFQEMRLLPSIRWRHRLASCRWAAAQARSSDSCNRRRRRRRAAPKKCRSYRSEVPWPRAWLAFSRILNLLTKSVSASETKTPHWLFP